MFQKGYYANGTSAPNLIFANFYAADFRVYGQSVTRSKLNANFMPIIKKNKIAGIMIYERVKKIGCESFDKKEMKFEITDYFELQDSLLGYQILERKRTSKD